MPRCCCPTASTACSRQGCTPAWCGRRPGPRRTRSSSVLTTDDQPVAAAARPAPSRTRVAPTAPQGLTVKEAAPFDGSARRSLGGAGVQRCGSGGVVPRPPRRGCRVLAHGHLGGREGPRAGRSTRSRWPRSAPRVRVRRRPRRRRWRTCPSRARSTRSRASKGGKLTAGAKWKAPADAGGFAISKYKVAVFKAGGTKVDTEVVKAGRLKFLVQARAGQVLPQGEGPERRPLGTVEQEDRSGPPALTQSSPRAFSAR